MKPWLNLLLTLLVSGAILLLSACAPAQPESVTGQPAYAPTPVPGEPIPDQEAAVLMDQLLMGSRREAQGAVEAILTARDARFSAVFIELLRARELDLIENLDSGEIVAALESLSGQQLGRYWDAWIEWYGSTDLVAPPGFTGWKGRLLGEIDPGFAEFLQDGFAATIRVEEIVWGGVMVDGIPALDNAAMVPAASAGYLEPGEPVFGISINNDHRAYPLRILDWHEMANDVVGDVPLSLAYCTLCGAGIAYDGRASDGQTYTFGSSGFLYRSNKLMYDRQTRSLWNQLTGEPVLGTLAGTGVKLDLLPVVVSTWADWLAQHPETVVLDIDTGYRRPYVPGAAYGDYFRYDGTMFPVWQRSAALETKDRVYALQVEGIPKAYPLAVLAEAGVVNDTIGGTDLVLVAARGEITVDGVNRRVGSVTYDAGGEVRAYERAGQTFNPGPDAGTLLDAAGRSWGVTEAALVGPDGQRLLRINGHLAYWFGWYAFFPKTLIYEGP